MSFFAEGLSALTKFAEDIIDDKDEEGEEGVANVPRKEAWSKRSSPLTQFQKNLISIEL